MLKLTAGAVDHFNAGEIVPDLIVKVMGYKNVPGSTPGQKRYRLLLSDGIKTNSFAMLATQLNGLIEKDELVIDSVIKVKKYVCNMVQKDKCVVIILDVEILGVDKGTSENAGRPPFRQVPSNTASDMTSLQPTRDVLKTPPKSSSPFTPSTPGTPSSGIGRVFPIQSLNPYQSRWTIRARVSQKATIRTWNKNGKEGKLFSFTLLDDSGEIRATAFNTEVDKFYDLIEVNRVYYVSRATLKAANKQYNTTKNDYEMTLNGDTNIVACEDGEELSVPQTTFCFVEIGKLDSHQPGDFIDVLGIAHETGELTSITAKATQRELQKREIGLVDASCCLIRLTLWGDDAVHFDGTNHPAVIVKSARISDFNGRSLSTAAQSSIIVGPTNVPEAIRLKGWYEHDGHTMNFETYRGEMSSSGAGGASASSGWNKLSDLQASGVGTNPKGDYFTCKATVTFMKKENFMYQACSTEGCNKKVIDLGNGLYRCEKCARETPSYNWRLLLMAKIADMSGEQWITCFQDTAQALLGRTADDLGTIKETQDETQLDNVFVNATFNSWVFKLRAKIDNFNDESRLRVIAMEAKPVNFGDYAKQLRKQIDEIIPTLPAELISGDIMS